MTKDVVAIDGPSASGKSTVARRVAGGLGYLYVDSGSLYRGITWKVLHEGINAADAGRVAEILKTIDISFFVADGAVRFRIDGTELKDEIRTIEVNENVSKIAAMPAVRSQVVAWLKDMGSFGSLVMEGRDIGTVVFPSARFKFYIDASEDERARRRFQEIHGGVKKITFTDVNESLRRRDAIDKGRKMDPLKVAPGAVIVDTTSMSIEKVVDFILARLKASPSS